MNNLKNAICYLSGPIEKAHDLGLGWRKEFIEKAKNLNLVIIDPCNKPTSFTHEIKGEMVTVNSLRKERRWTELTDYVKRFRREDLRFVDISDFLIVYIDPDVPSFGTLDELFTAEDQKKPLFCICVGGIDKLPSWLFAVFKLNEIFENIDQCIAYLNEINQKESLQDDRRWVLCRDALKVQPIKGDE